MAVRQLLASSTVINRLQRLADWRINNISNLGDVAVLTVTST